MKIIHISPRFAPHRGGVETHVLELSKELIAAGHEVTVLTNGEENFTSEETLEKIKIVRRPGGVPTLRTWSYKVAAWRWLWQKRHHWLAADVIHVHDVFWWAAPFMPWMSHKVFTTFHGWETVYPVKMTAKIQRFVWSWFSVGSIHVGDWIREFYWDRPTVVTYGAAVAVQNVPKKASLQLKKAVFFGRLSPENEVDQYYELFQALKKVHPKLQIIWIGDGPLRTKCEKLGIVTGMIANPEKYLAEANLVGASSYLALWQAQALGKVCLGFCSIPLKKRYLETFPGAANMLISNNVKDMLVQVTKVLDTQKMCSQLCADAHQTSLSYTWRSVAEMYQKLWK